MMRTTKRRNGASEPTTRRPGYEQAIAAAVRIDKLMIKHAIVGAQMDRIEQKIAHDFKILHKVFPSGGKRRKTIERPRPVSDKLIISAGKAISTALKNGSSLDQTKSAALKAAGLVAKKYGLSSIPEHVVANIEIRAQKHFKEVSA
jgi:hypothetical protein